MANSSDAGGAGEGTDRPDEITEFLKRHTVTPATRSASWASILLLLVPIYAIALAVVCGIQVGVDAHRGTTDSVEVDPTVLLIGFPFSLFAGPAYQFAYTTAALAGVAPGLVELSGITAAALALVPAGFVQGAAVSAVVFGITRLARWLRARRAA